MKVNIFLLIFVIAIVGCGPIQPQLKPVHFENKIQNNMNSIEIVDQSRGKKKKINIFGDTIVPIPTDKPTGDIVKEDVTEYLRKRISISKTSKKSLKVTIMKADSYYIIGPENIFPFISFFFVMADFEFRLELRILFEIIEEEKVIKSYSFEDEIILHDGKTSTINKTNLSYERLIQKYRKEVFNRLDQEFIDRYI